MIITKENLFQWNIEQVLTKIEYDYSNVILATFEANKDIETFEDWLSIHPDILGRYMLEQLNVNFDFEQFKNK